MFKCIKIALSCFEEKKQLSLKIYIYLLFIKNNDTLNLGQVISPKVYPKAIII